MNKIDVAALKQQAAGRWREVLSALGGIPAEVLDGRNHPCPKCSGKDRFRLIDVEAGALFCNQCFNQGNGDGIAAIQWLRGGTFPETVNALAEYLGQSSHRPNEPARNGKPKIVATYNYRDEQRKLLYQVVRYEPKDFKQRQPKDGGGWTWSVKGVRMVPYRLPDLLTAGPSQEVLIVEGEKDADNCYAHNLVATCNAGGAGKWRKEHAELLRGRKVCIIADKDDAGRKHAQQVAASLQGIATSIKAVEVPIGKDASDYFTAGGTVEDLLQLVEGAQEWKPDAAQPATDSSDTTAGTKPTQSTLLVNLALAAGIDLWHTADQDAYASLPVGEHVENCAVRSRYFRRWLSRLFYKSAEKTPGAQALQDATNVLEGIALYDRGQHESAVRLTEHESSNLPRSR